MIGNEPIYVHNSFTVAKPGSGNFAYYFFPDEDLMGNLLAFYETIFTKDLQIRKPVLTQVLNFLEETLEEFQEL